MNIKVIQIEWKTGDWLKKLFHKNTVMHRFLWKRKTIIAAQEQLMLEVIYQ